MDLWLIMALGFLGSFGHCAGMCGPLTVAFSLSHKTPNPSWQQQLRFHLGLNLGRVLSYALSGAAIGALGSVLIAGGQFAGIDSGLRRGMAVVTGILLIWLGLTQVQPNFPRLPLLHPLLKMGWHQWLHRAMLNLSLHPRWWTPLVLGGVWGLIPCGFLYAAQLKAAETGQSGLGSVTMLAFGLGTLPVMLGVGVSTSLLSADQRSQLFRVGGWVTIAIGLLTLLRSDSMVDFTGYAALGCLSLALLARPLSCLWAVPLRYRRTIGVGAFVLALAHTAHMLEHSLDWNLQALTFMVPLYQMGMGAGFLALLCMAPAAFTSSDRLMQALGNRWRRIHLLTVPALFLCATHVALVGSRYLGGLEWHRHNYLKTGLLGVVVLVVTLARSQQVWSWLHLERFYVSPSSK